MKRPNKKPKQSRLSFYEKMMIFIGLSAVVIDLIRLIIEIIRY